MIPRGSPLTLAEVNGRRAKDHLAPLTSEQPYGFAALNTVLARHDGSYNGLIDLGLIAPLWNANLGAAIARINYAMEVMWR